MGLLKRVIARSGLVVPAGLLACLGIVLLDLLAFHALGRRPLISYPEAELAVWAAMIASAWVYAARWVVLRERAARLALAGSLAAMLALASAHPYASGQLREAAAQQGVPAVSAPVGGGEVVEFSGGPLSEGRRHRA